MIIKNILAAKSESMSIPTYSGTGFKFENKTIGDIFSGLLPYIYVIAGLILLFMLIIGGLGLMTAAGDPKKVDASKGRITAALIGFLIVFVSYIVVQLVGVMLGVDLLGNGGSGNSYTGSGAKQVEVTLFNSDGEITSQETRDLEDEPDPDAEPCGNYSFNDCPSWCSISDGTCVDN